MILVTGGAGFIGSHLVRALLDRGHRVRVLDDLSSGRRENLDEVADRVEFVEGSIVDEEIVRRAVTGARAVFHLAACPSVVRSQEEPLPVHDVNASGTLQVLECASAAGVDRVVFAGSSAVYGIPGDGPSDEGAPLHPLSLYGAQKLLGEYYCRIYAETRGLRTVVLRYFNVFGPRQDPGSPYSGVISLFCDRMLRGELPTVHGDGQQTRDFTYVDNVVDGNLRALEAELEPFTVVNVATGRRVTLLEVLQVLGRALARDATPRFGPARIGDVRHSCADVAAAERLLGYRPIVDFATGLERTLDWYRGAVPATTGEEEEG